MNRKDVLSKFSLADLLAIKKHLNYKIGQQRSKNGSGFSLKTRKWENQEFYDQNVKKYQIFIDEINEYFDDLLLKLGCK